MKQVTALNKRKNITKRLSLWAIFVAGLLMIPLVARAPWTISDFLFAAVILFGCATTYEVATRNMKNRNHRILVAAVVLAILIGIWGIAVSGA